VFVPYIIGAVLLSIFIAGMLVKKNLEEKSYKKILNKVKYCLIDDVRSNKFLNWKAWRLKEVLQLYGMSTHDTGIRIECQVINSKGDKRLKPNEIGFEIVVRRSEGGQALGKPYFRKMNNVPKKNDPVVIVFEQKNLRGLVKHLAKILKP